MIDAQLVLSTFEFAVPVGSVLAYLDPGTGSYALQILLATLFGGMFALKQSWSALKVWYAAHLGNGRGLTSKENARPGIHGQPTAEIR